MEKAKGAIWREILVSKDWKRRFQLNSETHIQGILVGRHDRKRAIPYIAKIGIVRGKS